MNESLADLPLSGPIPSRVRTQATPASVRFPAHEPLIHRWIGVWELLRENFARIAVCVQISADVVTLLGTNTLCYLVYVSLPLGRAHLDPALYANLNFLASFAVIVVLAIGGAYENFPHLMRIEETRRVVRGLLIGFAGLMALSFFIRSVEVSRLTVTCALAANLVTLTTQRQILRRFYEWCCACGLGVRRVLIYGAGANGRRLARRLLEEPRLGFYPVGHIREGVERGRTEALDSSPNAEGLRVLGGRGDLRRLVPRLDVDEVLIATSSLRGFSRLGRAIASCRRVGVPYAFVPPANDPGCWTLQLADLAGVPLCRPRGERVDWLYHSVKRVFDALLASALLVLFLPAGLLIAFLIRIDSPGPVLFRQRRVGRSGVEFELFKFRTMWTESASYARSPRSAADPRVTGVGRWLRRTSLDELPQLLNVLRGDMSLVGPRPEMPFAVAQYEPRHRARLKVKPGITGIWQISGDRAYAIHENIETDLYYIANQNLLLDIAILMETLFVPLRGLGAW